MVCSNHVHENAVSRCSQCGDSLCEACRVTVGGSVICKKCAAEIISGRHELSAAEYRARPAPRGGAVGVNLFWILIFSCFPGLGHLYMGLIKRGLFFAGCFFASISVVFYSGAPTLGLLIPLVFFTALFDALSKRRLALRGVRVEDSVDEIADWVRRYKHIVGAVVLMLACLCLTRRLSRFGGVIYDAVGLFEAGIVFLGVAIVFIVAFGKKKTVRKEGDINGN